MESESDICEHTRIADSVVRQKLTRYKATIPNLEKGKKDPSVHVGTPDTDSPDQGGSSSKPLLPPGFWVPLLLFHLGEGWGSGLRESFWGDWAGPWEGSLGPLKPGTCTSGRGLWGAGPKNCTLDLLPPGEAGPGPPCPAASLSSVSGLWVGPGETLSPPPASLQPPGHTASLRPRGQGPHMPPHPDTG